VSHTGRYKNDWTCRLRHRSLITYEAEADSIDSDDIIKKIFIPQLAV
jgi:hypothetical protein